MPAPIMDQDDPRLLETYRIVLDRFRDDPAVMGIDIGVRYSANGRPTKELAVRVHVGDSLPEWRAEMWGKTNPAKPYAAKDLVLPQDLPAFVDRLDASFFIHTATLTRP